MKNISMQYTHAISHTATWKLADLSRTHLTSGSLVLNSTMSSTLTYFTTHLQLFQCSQKFVTNSQSHKLLLFFYLFRCTNPKTTPQNKHIPPNPQNKKHHTIVRQFLTKPLRFKAILGSFRSSSSERPGVKNHCHLELQMLHVTGICTY